MSEAFEKARKNLAEDKAGKSKLVAEVRHLYPEVSKQHVEDVLDALWVLGKLEPGKAAQMDTQTTISHLKALGYDIYQAVPEVSKMTDQQLQLWRTKIVAWGQDMRRDQSRLSEMIHDEIDRRESASANSGS